MAALLSEIRFALRALRRSPGFTLATLGTLTLGIGVNTTVFSLVDGLLLRPLPAIADPGALVSLFGREDDSLGVASYVDFLDFRERCRSFSGLTAHKLMDIDLAAGEVTERVEGALVTAGYFEVLGVEPALGRSFLPAEDRDPGEVAVAVLGHALWRDRFGADPAAVGGTVTLNGRSFAIVGVAPPGFAGTGRVTRPLLFVPMAMQPHFMPASGNLLGRRGWGGVQVTGRLAPGVSLESARSEVAGVAAALERAYPETNAGRGYHVGPFRPSGLPPAFEAQAAAGSALLLAVGLVVLVVACVNLSNFTLARGLARRRELAVRRALGSGRRRLVAHFLAESLLLAVAGGGLSLLVAMWATDLLASLVPFLHLDVALDLRVLAFTLAASVAAGHLFSLGPALHLSRIREASALREGDAALGRGRGRRLSRGLVVAQVALSLALMVVAGLVGRTWAGLRTAQLGFDPEGVLIARLDPGLQGYAPAESAQFYGQLADGVAALPGIEGASYTSVLPWAGMDTESFDLDGYEPPSGRPLHAQVDVVGPAYFETLRLPVTAGRSLGLEDRPVVVVNRAAARWFADLTGRAPLGARIRFGGPEGPWAEVVGVAEDAVTTSLRERPGPTVYLPANLALASGLGSRMVLLVRTSGEPLAALPGVREALRALDPDLPLVAPGTLEGHLDTVLAPEKVVLGLTGASALLVLALAAVGLYGLLAQGVHQRRGELGIRLALGARAADLERMVVAEGMALVGIGTAVGLAAALAAGRLLRGFLYRVSPGDPATLAATTAALAAVALLACYLPARRAGRVDPLRSIRAE